MNPLFSQSRNRGDKVTRNGDPQIRARSIPSDISAGSISRAVYEYCWLCQLVSGMGQKRDPSVFPIDLQTVLGDALRLSPSTAGSPDWFQE